MFVIVPIIMFPGSCSCSENPHATKLAGAGRGFLFDEIDDLSLQVHVIEPIDFLNTGRAGDVDLG